MVLLNLLPTFKIPYLQTPQTPQHLHLLIEHSPIQPTKPTQSTTQSTTPTLASRIREKAHNDRPLHPLHPLAVARCLIQTEVNMYLAAAVVGVAVEDLLPGLASETDLATTTLIPAVSEPNGKAGTRSASALRMSLTTRLLPIYGRILRITETSFPLNSLKPTMELETEAAASVSHLPLPRIGTIIRLSKFKVERFKSRFHSSRIDRRLEYKPRVAALTRR